MSYPPFSHFLHQVNPEFLCSLKMFSHSYVPEQALCVVLLPKTLFKCCQIGAQFLCWPSGFPWPSAGEPSWIRQACALGGLGNAHRSEGPCKSAATHRCFNKLDEWLMKVLPSPAGGWVCSSAPVVLWLKESAAPWGAPVWSTLWRCHVPKCQQGNEQ